MGDGMTPSRFRPRRLVSGVRRQSAYGGLSIMPLDLRLSRLGHRYMLAAH